MNHVFFVFLRIVIVRVLSKALYGFCMIVEIKEVWYLKNRSSETVEIYLWGSCGLIVYGDFRGWFVRYFSFLRPVSYVLISSSSYLSYLVSVIRRRTGSVLVQ